MLLTSSNESQAKKYEKVGAESTQALLERADKVLSKHTAVNDVAIGATPQEVNAAVSAALQMAEISSRFGDKEQFARWSSEAIKRLPQDSSLSRFIQQKLKG